jgi:putative transposase
MKPPRKTGGPSHPVKAIRPGHVYVLDFTEIRGFFRSVAVGAVIDVFTRRVLAIRVWPREPGAASTTRLLQKAIDRGGRPAWVISDRGRQFRSRRFRGFLTQAGIRRRYAALGDANLSKIDRFWRSMKDEVGRGLLLFQPTQRLQKKLEDYARWFNTERPHVGLNHRTPEDVVSGATLPSRNIRSSRLEVRFLNGDRELPIFRLRDAA